MRPNSARRCFETALTVVQMVGAALDGLTLLRQLLQGLLVFGCQSLTQGGNIFLQHSLPMEKLLAKLLRFGLGFSKLRFRFLQFLFACGQGFGLTRQLVFSWDLPAFVLQLLAERGKLLLQGPPLLRKLLLKRLAFGPGRGKPGLRLCHGFFACGQGLGRVTQLVFFRGDVR